MIRATLLALAAILALGSCAPEGYLSIDQAGKSFALRSGGIQTLRLQKRDFALRARIKGYDEAAGSFYDIKVIASRDPGIFDRARVGEAIGDESCFGPGKGMAMDPNSRALFIADDGYNNVFYEASNEARSPMKLSRRLGDGYEAVAAVIGLVEGERAGAIEQWRPGALNLMFFYDANLNEVIDGGELLKARLVFDREG
jgi:hypothetical protein